MADTPNFDIQQAHKYFSARCFNRTWDYMQQGGKRSTEENMALPHTAIASLWHWTQREDISHQNLSVGPNPEHVYTYGNTYENNSYDADPFVKNMLGKGFDIIWDTTGADNHFDDKVSSSFASVFPKKSWFGHCITCIDGW